MVQYQTAHINEQETLASLNFFPLGGWLSPVVFVRAVAAHVT